MNTSELTYPIFEANQVLTSAHLNDLFEYLDEQTRLTRANLIGIGIVCGLDVEFDEPGTVRLSKGCGVTSEGYLIIEPTDLELSHVRKYSLPDPGYPPFMEPGTNPAKSHDLWELFPDDDEPGSQLLATSGLVLEDKAVVLFHEQRKDDLRNCSPNNCDDRGAEVTTTVRRLLIDVADLDEVIATTSGTAAYLGADLSERLDLPDLRMPRFDVPNTGPVTAEQVLFAFQQVFRETKLVSATATALNRLYDALRPLVVADFPNNPFAAFTNRFGFLDATPATVAQVRYMQYYWDFFDDLLAAYDEVRWAGVDLMCACCPPSGLFPRHLMAGVLDQTLFDPADYRHHFLPSPAVGDCEDRTREVRQLFRRIVTMVAAFTETPPDKGVRVTPSRWGDPVSTKAIPYYYDQDDSPAVYELWNPERTAHRRANQNLSYRSDEYTPAPPAFTTNPLRFDLEPFNFLRIEGHLGKNVQSVLESLLALKKSHRLPIEVIALRAGVFDESMDVDLSEDDCRFQDLETLYKTLKSELTCFLVKEVKYFYELPDEVLIEEQPTEMLASELPDDVLVAEQPPEISIEVEPAPSDLWLLTTHAPGYLTQPGTLGHKIEGFLTREDLPSEPFVFVAADTPHLPSQAMALVGTMSDLSARLTDDIREVDFPALSDRYRKLVEIAGQIEDLRQDGVFDRPGLSERLDDIVFRCRLDPFEALAEEYKRRIRQVKQAQFLRHFLERHPGVQHKAGVPLDGTFVLVYHELAKRSPEPETGPRPGDFLSEIGRRRFMGLDEAQEIRVSDALSRLRYKPQLAEDPDIKEMYRVLTGNVLVSKVPPSRTSSQIYLDAIAQLSDGTVIADFFLPYQCSSNCPPIHYQLPSARLRVSTTKACTNADGFAEVELAVEGASGPLSVQVDGGAFEETSGILVLDVGDHTIVVRDASGNESSPVEVNIPPQLVIGASETIVDEAAGKFHVVLALEGGTPPYSSSSGTIIETKYTSPAWPIADVLTVLIEDAAGCTVEDSFESGVSPCDLPCEGAAERHGYRFWLPEARPNLPINGATTAVRSFTVTGPDGTQHDLTDKVNEIVTPPQVIRTADYGAAVKRWLEGINGLVAGPEVFDSDQWFRLEYEGAPETGTTGTMFVDRLTCIEFSFELAVEFKQGQREEPWHFEFAYDPRGTVVVEPNAESKFRIPPFEGSASNKCRPQEPPVPLCMETDLELVIQSEGAFPDMMAFIADVRGDDQPVAFLWEVQDGIPSVAGGEHVVVVTFDPPEPVEKLVRLTVFTESGCAVTVEEIFNIVEPNG